MRIKLLLVAPLVGAFITLPANASAQVQIGVTFGARLGPEIGVFAYDQQRMGDWRNSYRRWTPVTLYDVNGHYYRTNVRGSRPVLVYSYNNEYFMPPQDQAWVGMDHRYNYQRQPTPADYGRSRPYAPAPRVDPRLGAEIGVLGYSPDRAGDWRNNVRRWTPTTVYESNGRYYQHSAPGARAVGIYRYQNEYFLPPTDQAWVGSDKRYDYNHRPDNSDQGRVRIRP